MQANGDEAAITGINVTPLVDIILVVLIIFMATAPLIQRRVMKVDVPKAAHNERAATEAIAVVLNAKRELLVQGVKLSEDELQRRLWQQVRQKPGLHVTLSADKTLPYGEIVALLDRVRAAGVRKIGLEVVRR